jgi:hypothetical protein
MLEHIMKLKNCIRKSLIDLDSKIKITDKEFDTILSVVACVTPVKLAVEALCRNDATLLSADTTLLFTVNNLADTELVSDGHLFLACCTICTTAINDTRINTQRCHLSTLKNQPLYKELREKIIS